MVHNRRNYKKSLVISLMIVMLSVSPVFANHVQIDPNSVGQTTEYFHAYNSNTNIVNSYIDSGTSVFSKAFNYLAMNIAKSTSSIYAVSTYLSSNLTNSLNSITTNQTTINSNVTALQSLLSNINNSIGITNGNLAGVRQDVQGLYTKIDQYKSDMWTSLTYNPVYQDGSHNNINYQAYQNIGKDMYISTPDNNSILPNSILHIRLPISYQSNLDHLTIDFTNYRYTDFQVPYYYVIPSMWEVDIYYISPFNAVGSTYIHLHNDYGLRFTDTGISGSALCEYILPSNVNYKYYLEIMFNYQNHNELISKLDNIQVSSDFDDSNIIDAINNLSLTDNNVKVTVNYTQNDANGVQNIIPYIRSFFDNNISVSDFIGESNDVQDNWFSQTNKDIVESISGGYVDLYD